MCDLHLAERILQLVASPTDSTAIVGDIREIADTRGELWFVLAVARTGFRLLWKDLTAEPWFMVKLAMKGFLVVVVMTLIVLVPAGIAVAMGKYAGWQPPRWVDLPFQLSIDTFASYQAGRFLASRSQQREMAALVTFCVLGWVANMVMLALPITHPDFSGWKSVIGRAVPFAVLIFATVRARIQHLRAI